MSAVEHVAGPIHRVPLGFVAAYLVAAHDGAAATLVDTGVRGRAGPILEAVGRLPAGVGQGRVGDVLLTHCHGDHAGSLAAVVGRTGARVHAHPLDAAVVRAGGPQPPAVPGNPLVGLLGAVAGRLAPASLEPAPVDVEIEEGASVPGGLRAIHTPGHTPGHLSFLWPDDGGVLVVGDAAANVLGRLELGPVNSDPAVARASFARLAGLDFEVACFGHGPPLRGRANAAFRARLDRLAAHR